MSHSSDLHKHLRFSRDIRTIPLADGKGNQDDYVSAVQSWQ